MKKIEAFIISLANKSNYLAAFATMLIMMVTVFDVIFRVFRISVPGSYDIISLFGSVIISFSLAYTSYQKGHIAVEFLFQKLPLKAQHILTVITEFIACGFFLVVSWQSAHYAFELISSGEVSSTIKFPIYPFAAGMALSTLLLAVLLAVNFVNAIKRVIKL